VFAEVSSGGELEIFDGTVSILSGWDLRYSIYTPELTGPLRQADCLLDRPSNTTAGIRRLLRFLPRCRIHPPWRSGC